MSRLSQSQPGASQPNRRWGIWVLCCFVFISGGASLVYEVVWSRQLATFLGITGHAHTAVIAAFMAGLALGSLVAGRLAVRVRHPIRWYAIVEILIGCYALASPWIFTLAEEIYAVAAPMFGIEGGLSHTFRLVIAFACVLLPTFLMGTTLPLLVQGIPRNRDACRATISKLYGVNTLGAALGTFAAGYLLLPLIGVQKTSAVAAFASILAGTGVLAFCRHMEVTEFADRQTRPAPAETGKATHGSWLLIGFGISGFAALVYQLAWIRALTLVIGSSVYAFSATVTSFLIGIAIGSLISIPIQRRSRQARTMAVAFLQFGIGLVALASIYLIGRLPEIFLRTLDSGVQSNFFAFQCAIFGMCFLVMALPTIALGVVFPLVTALWVERDGNAGAGVGNSYAANTIGSVLGAVFAGLVFLPSIGTYNTVILASVISCGIGCLFWWHQERYLGIRRYAGVACLAVITVTTAVALPRWDLQVMNAGLFYRSDVFLQRPAGVGLQDIASQGELLFYEEGVDGIVSVTQTQDQRLLTINGKIDASSRTDLKTQTIVGILPLAAHTSPKSCLVIGLGSGITAGAVASGEGVEEVDVLEISRPVVTASKFFSTENGNVLSNSKTSLILADARNYLRVSQKKYDVIVSEPSNPWISGISNLFTYEAFDLSRSALSPNGIMAQWFHTYKMDRADILSILRTYHSVFPFVSVWTPQDGDLVLIGSEQPQEFDADRIRSILAGSGSGKMLQKIGIRFPEQFLACYLMDLKEIESVYESARWNTDDIPYLEFNAPRHLYSRTRAMNLHQLTDSLADRKVRLPIANVVQSSNDRCVHLPSIGLSIEASDVDKQSIETSWFLERHILVKKDIGSAVKLANGQQVLVTWNGQQFAGNQLLASFEARDMDARRSLMRALLGNDVSKDGDLMMKDGIEAYWMIGPGRTPGQLAFVLTWEFPLDTRKISYTSLCELTDPGKKNWEAALLEFSSQFRQCGEREGNVILGGAGS